MSYSVEDVLGTYLLLDLPILRDDDQQETFAVAIRDTLNAETLARDSSLAIPALRIYVGFEDHRTVMKRDYPQSESDLASLADVIELAFSIAGIDSNKRYSFTWSTWLTYQQEEDSIAGRYLGNRMFKEISLESMNMRVIGGSGIYHIVSSDDESAMWIAKFQPRYSDPNLTRLFLDLDWRNTDTELPTDRDKILQCLQKVRATSTQLIKDLHSNV